MNEQATAGSTGQPQSSHGFAWELLRTGLIVLVIVLPIRLFVAQPFIVSGASMQPNFDTGDYLIIDQLSYEFNEPQRFDVVVFRYPNDPSKFFIKRIIGLPGETVELGTGGTTIYNARYPEGYDLDETYVQNDYGYQQESLQRQLAEDEYFVMGDNRDSSSDSRSWGALPAENIIGRAYVRLLPPAKAEITPGYGTDQSGAGVAREAP